MKIGKCDRQVKRFLMGAKDEVSSEYKKDVDHSVGAHICMNRIVIWVYGRRE